MEEFVVPSIEAAEHGAALTQHLLAFSRKQTLQPKVVSVNELLASFLALARRILSERIDVVTKFEPDIWNVHVDPGQFESMLLNLSVNARDAMPDGGKLIYETQNVYLDKDYILDNPDILPGDYVMVAISDTGKGMTPEVVEKAFEPFFTTKEMGTKASGLGLSMVYGFVKQSAGHIKLYSEDGHGTTVKIYLPRVDRVPSQPVKEEKSAIPTENHSKLILIVEDSKNVLKLTTTMVESLGYKVLHASTGDAALEILESRNDIDLLLTDVMLMGRVNGPDLAKRAVQLHPKIKVLFNSGYAEHAIIQSGILEEGVHLLSKPFRKQQLADKLAKLLK